jgi:Flp pilus assembly protein TadG
MLRRFKRRGADESGVVLVLVAMFMTAMLGMAALAIDIGSFYQAQRQAQSAADAGALAASQNLPSSTTLAKSNGTTYATTNYPGATATVSTPYNGNSTQVKVTVNATTPSFFGRIFGLTSQNVTASAVASETASGPPAAVFANDSACGPSNGLLLEIGTSVNIPGGVQSNGSINASGSGGTYGPSTYGGTNSCQFYDSSGPTANTYGGANSPTFSSTPNPYPVDYRNTFYSNPSSCTFSGGDLNLQNDNNQTLSNGTYCYSSIEFNSSGMTCTCTFWASSSFQFNNTGNNFTPYFGNLLFYYTGTSSLNVNSNGNQWLLNGGTLFAPNASVTINAPSNTTVSGFLEAEDVTINGSGPLTWNGSGPASGTSGASLLQ